MSRGESVSVPIGETDSVQKKPDVKLFGLLISNFPATPRFLLLALSVFFFYLMYGYMLVSYGLCTIFYVIICYMCWWHECGTSPTEKIFNLDIF